MLDYFVEFVTKYLETCTVCSSMWEYTRWGLAICVKVEIIYIFPCLTIFICRVWKMPRKRTKSSFSRKVSYLFCKEQRRFFSLVKSYRLISHHSAKHVLSPHQPVPLLPSPSPLPPLPLPTISTPKYNTCQACSADQPFKIFFIVFLSLYL